MSVLVSHLVFSWSSFIFPKITFSSLRQMKTKGESVMVSVKVYFQLSAIYHFLFDIFVYRGSNLRLLVPILLLNLKEINHTLLNIHI